MKKLTKTVLIISYVFIISFQCFNCSPQKNFIEDDIAKDLEFYETWPQLNNQVEIYDLMTGRIVTGARIDVQRQDTFARLAISADGYRNNTQILEFPQWSPLAVPMTPLKKDVIRKSAWKKHNAPRLILLELDGMTEMLFLEFMKRGDLPCFEILLEKGSWGLLESCCGLSSPAVWTTIHTGLPVSEHGIEDFTKIDPKTKELCSNGPEDVKAPRIWEISTAAGFNSLIGSALLLEEDLNIHNNTDFFGEKILATYKESERIHPRLLILYEAQADAIGHMWWWTRTPDIYRAKGWHLPENRVSFLSSRLETAYKMLDAWVGVALSLAGPETIILAVSDHGFKGTDISRQFDITDELLFQATGIRTERMELEGNRISWRLKNRSKALAFAKILAEATIDNGLNPFLVEEMKEGNNEGEISVEAGIDMAALAEGYWTNLSVMINKKEIPLKKLLYPLFSGDHMEKGLYFIAGSDVIKGAQVQNASVFDVMPTALTILGLPVSDEMPGRVWRETFNTPLSIGSVSTYGRFNKKSVSRKNKLTLDEITHLKSLGYLH